MSYFAFVKKSDPQYKGYSDEQIATAIQSIDPEFSGAKPAEVMDILNSMDEGGSRQYHESLWDKVPKEPAAAPEPAQEPTRTPEPQGLGEVGAMDYVYAAARGAGELPVALGWLVKKIPGLESAGKSIQEVGDTAVKYWEEQLSPAAKAEMTKEFVRYNEETGEYELGEAGWHTAGLTASGSLASSVAGMGIGGAVTKGMLAAIPTRAGLKAVGTGGAASNIATRATTTGLPARGALATKMKAEAAKKLGRQESIAGAIGFGAGEGAISGVMSAKEVEEEILKTDPKKLVTVPEFQELYHSPEMADLPHKERFEATRAEMASRGSTEAGWTAGLTTALLGAPLGAAFGRALFGKRPISDTRLKSAVFGGLGEAAQEAVQSGAEQAIQNRAVQQYADPTRDIGKGVVSSAVSGAAAGGVMGGTIGAVTGGQPQLPAPEDAEQPKSMKDKEIDEGAQKAATSVENQEKQPTEAQKKSGNYKKGPVTVHGMKVSVENPKGSIRSGVSGDGTQWDRQMTAHYGYVKGTDAADGDQVDAFVSGEGPIHIVDQVNPETGEFDEHKVIIGPETQEEAAALYRSNYEPGWQGLGAINPVSVEEFKGWKSDKSKTKQPFVVAKAGTTTGVPDARGVTWKGKAVVTPAATEVPPTGVPEGVPDGALAPDAAAVEPVAPAAPAPAAAPAAPIVTPESQPAVAPEVPEAAAPAPVVTPVAPAPGAPPVAAQETTTVTPAQEEPTGAQEQPSKPLREEGQEAGQPSEPVRGVPDVDQAVVPDRQASEEKAQGAQEQVERNYNRSANIKNTDSLIAAIAKLGGIGSQEAEAQGVDPESFKSARWGIHRAFNSGERAQSFDGMAETLRQYGWNYTGPNDLLEAIDSELKGNPQYTAEGAVAADEEQRDALYVDPLLYNGDMFEPNLTDGTPVYQEDLDEEGRLLTELAIDAANINPEKTQELLESGASDSAVSQGLFEIIRSKPSADVEKTETKPREVGGATGEKQRISSETAEQTKRITETASQIAGGTNTRVFLSDLHDALPDLTPDQINQAILGMADNGQAALYPIENPRELTEARGRDPIIAGGEANQIVYFEQAAEQPEVATAAEKISAEPATGPPIPGGAVHAKKQPDGAFSLVFKGTDVEVFPGITHKSHATARRYFSERNKKGEVSFPETVAPTKKTKKKPLDQITVSMEAQVEETGEQVKYDVRADIALAEIDARIESYEQLKRCLES